MQGLLGFSRGIDRVTVAIGRAVYWCILLAVLVSAGNAISRKLFSLSSNAWLELQWYLFGAAFLLAAAYTLQRNEHIRIDIVSAALPPGVRNWIDVFGHVFMLLPFTGFMIWRCYWYLLGAIHSGEVSASYGGLIIWPARLLILLGFILLFVQGLSELIKRVAVIRGLIPDPHALQPAHQVSAEPAGR
jgi:TRAP-type mannitol/chloroaromatic compound transport system permease small subunit